MIPFYKANSIGNIIGVIPEHSDSIQWTQESVQSFCSKGWGMDCDQLMVLGPTITIWNRNGTQAEACGNGIRCVIAVLKNQDDTSPVTLQGPVGRLEGWRQRDGRIAVVQGPVSVGAIHGMETPPHTILFKEIGAEGIPVHVGNPHVVVLAPPPENLSPDWQPTHPLFPKGLNVSFVSSVNEKLLIQTWERGVGRTLSCGSGACAVAATLYKKGVFQDKMTLEAPGGTIQLHQTSRGWVHTAPAHIIATGHWFAAHTQPD